MPAVGYLSPMRYRFLSLIFLATAVCAFGRELPADGVKAELGAIEYPYVKLGGKPVRLSPGARIFDQKDQLVLPYSFAGRVPALYKLDIRGDVQTIWLLTSDEIASLKNKKKAQ